MKQRLLPIGYASLLLGLLFNSLFYDHGFGVNFFIYVALILVITSGFMVYWHRRFSPAALSLGGIAALFALATCLRASGFVQFLDVIGTLYLLTLVGLFVWKPERPLSEFIAHDYLRRSLRLPFLALSSSGRLLRRAAGFNFESNQATKRRMMPVIRGILISLPILVIFLLLFASADLVFKQYVNSIFTLHLSGDLVAEVLLIVAVSSFFAGLYALLFTHSVEEPGVTPRRFVNIGAIEATVILGSVVGLFLLFVIIQLNYLFGGQSNVALAGGYTYAEYARKGFFELILVAVIVFLLLLGLHASTIRQTVRQHLVFTGLCAVLVLEVGLIMLSAHHRLSLYEQAYGFTELRLYSHLFIGWLATVTALLLAYIIRKQPQKWFARGIFISVIVFLGVINLMNPDAFVTRQNIERYETTGKIDIPYLGTLSADATPVLVTLLDDKNPQTQQAVAYELYLQASGGRFADESWQSTNLSRHRAQQLLHDHDTQLQAAQNHQPTEDQSRPD